MPRAKQEGVRVIIGDDNPDALKLLALLLKTFDHRVIITFSNASDGLNQLQPSVKKRQKPADVALLDGSLIENAGEDGNQLLRVLGNLGVGIYCLTAYDQPPPWVGQDHFIPKQKGPQAVLQVLDSLKK